MKNKLKIFTTYAFFAMGCLANAQIGIGTTTPASGFEVNTSMGLKVTTITSATTLDQTHNVVLCNTGPYTVTLPAASSCSGRVYKFKNIDPTSDPITLDGNGSDLIEGNATYLLYPYKITITIISDGTQWHAVESFNDDSVGAISALNCGGATHNGVLAINQAASGVSSEIPYTWGNGGGYSGQTVTSTGVTGLTATLDAGIFSSGSGSLTYIITGTPTTAGTASFAISVAGRTCTLDRTVEAFCSGSVTFTYNGTSVTYGKVLSPTGQCWLDRNLGATQVATSTTDHLAYGDLFQWGRGADGHQLITWTNSTTGTAVNGTTSTQSTTDDPGHGDFITNSNWRNPTNGLLWQGVSGTNNPCPSGFRLPSESEMIAEYQSWSTNNAEGAFGSNIKLPMAGNRSAGNGTINSGSYGRYWTDFWSGSNSKSLYFDLSSVNTSVGITGFGNAIRCIKN